MGMTGLMINTRTTPIPAITFDLVDTVARAQERTLNCRDTNSIEYRKAIAAPGHQDQIAALFLRRRDDEVES